MTGPIQNVSIQIANDQQQQFFAQMEPEIISQARLGNYIEINRTVHDHVVFEWAQVGCFERFWRWIVSLFGCCESTEAKCQRVSRENFQRVIQNPVQIDNLGIQGINHPDIQQIVNQASEQPRSQQTAQTTSQETRPTYVLPDTSIQKMQEIQRIAGIPGSKNDRLVGVFVGQAVGDAIGVTTEFMDKRSAQRVVNLGQLEYSTRFNTPQFTEIENGNVQNRRTWRLNFPFGGSTDDTDQAFLIIRAINRSKLETGKTVQQLFAEELINWIDHGMQGRDFSAQPGGRENPRFSTPKGLGLGNLVGTAMGILPNRNSDIINRFIQDPKGRALEAWNDPRLNFNGDKPAANGALMRCGPIAALISDYDQMIQMTIDLCEVTHVDPRCVASCVALNTAIHALLNGEEDLVRVKEEAFAEGRKHLALKCEELSMRNNLDVYANGLSDAIYAYSLDDLNLDDSGRVQAIGGTYQCLAAAFATFRVASENINSLNAVRIAITALVSQGGDSDTNCAVAGSLIGAFLGYSKIPDSWKQLRDQNILLEMIQSSEYLEEAVET